MNLDEKFQEIQERKLKTIPRNILLLGEINGSPQSIPFSRFNDY